MGMVWACGGAEVNAGCGVHSRGAVSHRPALQTQVSPAQLPMEYEAPSQAHHGHAGGQPQDFGQGSRTAHGHKAAARIRGVAGGVETGVHRTRRRSWRGRHNQRSRKQLHAKHSKRQGVLHTPTPRARVPGQQQQSRAQREQEAADAGKPALQKRQPEECVRGCRQERAATSGQKPVGSTGRGWEASRHRTSWRIRLLAALASPSLCHWRAPVCVSLAGMMLAGLPWNAFSADAVRSALPCGTVRMVWQRASELPEAAPMLRRDGHAVLGCANRRLQLAPARGPPRSAPPLACGDAAKACARLMPMSSCCRP